MYLCYSEIYMTKDDPNTTSLRCYEDLQRYDVDEENEPGHHIEKRYAGNVNVKNVAEKTLDFKYIVPAQTGLDCYLIVNPSSLGR